jgi:hypothetical protein
LTRRYQPTTLPGLARAYAAGGFTPDDDVVEATSDSEDDEYAALMTAADLSAERLVGLADGLRRRVVVVLDAGGNKSRPDSRPDILAVHADPVDDADPDDDLAWYATQELDSLLDFS